MNCAKLRAGLALSFVAALLLGAACKRNHPPSVPEIAGRLTYRPGDTARLSATATDQDDDSLSYLFAWVDSANADWSENYASGATAVGTHLYAAADTYSVRVKVQDERGAASDWSPEQSLRVGLFAPGIPARPAGPSSGVTADTYRCSTRATSPYGEPVLIEFDWDGVQAGPCPAVPSDSPCIGTHVFNLAGTYHIRARAGDTTGLYSAWSDSLAVAVICQDTTPPSVNIISPADGDSVRRGLIAVKAVATDDQIVTRVEFAIDGTLKGTDSVAEGDTYSYAWADTVTQVPNQSHTIVATAVDAGGNRTSDSLAVTVVCQDTTPPSVSIVSPTSGERVRRGLVTFKAVADDDQIVTKVEFFIDGALKGTDSVAHGDTFSYAWTDTVAQVPDQDFAVVATAFDAGGNRTSDSISITVNDVGVRWFWQGPEQGGMKTSAIVANDGEDEVVMSYCWDDWTFRTIKAYNGHSKSSATTYYAEYDFDGHPALCAATGHVITGSDEGELYALTLPDLSRAWRWPNMPAESLEPFCQFGAPAINGSDIYVGRDVDVDSFGRLYKFTDLGSSVTLVADCKVGKDEVVVDAPAIDGTDGSVYFSTERGYLIKIDKDLVSPLWRRQLIPGAELGGPIVGNDRTVYCAVIDTPAIVFAINPDGTTKWTQTLDAPGPRLALGQSALFVGTEMGTAYSINPGTGTINWQKSFSGGVGFNTTPIVAANGYLYIQDDSDVLYCLNQSDATLIWACDCNYYLPGSGRGASLHRPRKPGLTNYDPNPSVTAEGDIIVVGQHALFCVAGDSSQLDVSAPWPKWQKNLFNTGK